MTRIRLVPDGFLAGLTSSRHSDDLHLHTGSRRRISTENWTVWPAADHRATVSPPPSLPASRIHHATSQLNYTLWIERLKSKKTNDIEQHVG